MTTSMSAGLVGTAGRVTVVSAGRRVDLVVPAQLPVAELLAVVVASLGPAAAEFGATEGGWLLQAVGGAPLDPGASLEDAGVPDAAVLHLRTRASAWPAAVVDDVLEVVAEAARTGARRWSPADRAHATAAGAASVATAAAVVAAVAPPSGAAGGVLAGGTLLFAVLSAGLRRPAARGDAGPLLARVSGALALVYAAVSGDVLAAAAGGSRLAAPALLAACGSMLAVASALLVLLPGAEAALVGAATAAGLGAAGAGLGAAGLPAAGAAAAVVGATLLLGPAVPALAVRVAGPAAVGRDGPARDDPVDHAVDRTVRADRVLTGLVGGMSAALAGGAAVLAACDGTAGAVLAVVAGGCWLLRARAHAGAARHALHVAGGLAALLCGGATAAMDGRQGDAVWLLATTTAAASVAAGALLALATRRRRWPPSITRAADALETLLVLAAVPLAVAVAGGYAALGRLLP